MSLKKKLERLEKNRPQYKISEEFYDNKNIATNAANGRDNSAVNAEKQLNQNTSDAMSAAKSASSSGAGILALLGSAEASNNSERVNIANQEAQAQEAGKADLAQANDALATEKDKAWDYNVNQPYQNKVAALRERRKARQELLMKGIDSATTMVSAATSAAGQTAQSGGGAMAMMCWVARAIYGEQDERWYIFRDWLVVCAPKWFRDLYTMHGESFASFINKYPFIKPAIKPFFDSKVKHVNKLINGIQGI